MSINANLETRDIPIADLKAAPYNPRQISEQALKGLEASLTRFGLVEPIVWNETTGHVVGGHQRLKVLERAGVTSTRVVVVRLSPTEEKALNVTLNNKAIQGDWTAELARVIDDLRASLAPEDYLDLQIKALEAEIPEVDAEENKLNRDPDAVPDIPAVPVSRIGQIWALGNHRVMCGDSTMRESYQALFGENRASMAFTDPPYNVNYKGSNGLKIENDHMGDEEFRLFLGGAFSCLAEFLLPGSGVYVCHSDTGGVTFRIAFMEAGLELKQCLVWVKNSLVLGRQDYQWKHEPILYGWKPGAAHRWFGGRDKTTVIENRELLAVSLVPGGGFLLTVSDGVDTHVIRVPAYEVESSTAEEFTTIWRFAKPQKNADHPTMKPVGIPARAISHSSQRGEIVLEPFLGSGSTLIACEQLGRRCFGFELDPRYMDVVIRRWEEFTGGKAEVVA